MPKMIVSIDGVVIKEVQLTKDRTTMGRRPYNDIVIDNLAVSGEHAVIQLMGNDVYIEDLNSTNGTYLNGKAIKKQLLQNNDTLEVGKYKIRFVNEGGANFDKTMVIRAGAAQPAVAVPPQPPVAAPPPVVAAPAAPVMPKPAEIAASIKVLSGAAIGRELQLIKVVTTIGKPGTAVAAITKRPQGYVIAHVEGGVSTTLNGQAIGSEPVLLGHGDLLELAGTQMQFLQAG
jgi:pSer/pThr/pTyr-binding forkhead associated (FHA) protein